jgi:hypothetical protein
MYLRKEFYLPQKAIELVENLSARAICESKPRYDVMLHGKKFDQLYYNMRGFVGYLPTPNGAKLDIGEKSIGAFRREVAVLNREFAAAAGTST